MGETDAAGGGVWKTEDSFVPKGWGARSDLRGKGVKGGDEVGGGRVERREFTAERFPDHPTKDRGDVVEVHARSEPLIGQRQSAGEDIRQQRLELRRGPSFRQRGAGAGDCGQRDTGDFDHARSRPTRGGIVSGQRALHG